MDKAPIPKITLDTNIPVERWKEQSKHEVVERILELGAAGRVDLAVTRYIHDDIPDDPLASRIHELAELGVATTGGMFTIGVSRLDGTDRLGDERMLALQRLFELLAQQGGPRAPGAVDWLHLHAHLANGRDVFLTWDGPILRAREALAQLGVVVQTPEEFLSHL